MSQRPDDIFLAGCGMAAPWKITVSRPGHATREHDVEQPFLLVGAAEGNGLRLEDPQVAACHAYLQVLPEGVFFIDLGSGSVTTAGGEPRYHGWLRPGEFVHVGPFVLEVSPANLPDSLPTWNPLSRPPDTEVGLPLVASSVYGADGVRVGRWRMNAVVALLGTSPRCKARLHHDSVSAFHCALVRTRLGLWAIDLVSARGTLLNGRRIECERVNDGDRLQIGSFLVGMRLQARTTGPSGDAQYSLVPVTEARTFAVTGVAPGPTPVVAAVAESGVPEASVPASLMYQFGRIQQQLFDQFHRDLQAMAGLFLTMHKEHLAAVAREMDDLRRIADEIQGLQSELRQQLATPRLAGPALPARDRDVPAPPPKTAPESTAAAAARVPPVNNDAAGAPATGEPVQDIHAWLNQRIAALTTEHQSRWQKLLGLILGK
jgi:pSer/pThr/pTyr-binding forkhead associated (FHA) protein